MAHVTVVGSGPSGVHFALQALRKGMDVTMVDGGREGDSPVLPDASLNELKERLDDPGAYFLGEGFEGVLLPAEAEEYYGIPPHKQYVFDEPAQWPHTADGFSPLFSFARGGLAEAWTGGCYPFNDAELVDFPFDYSEIGPWYDRVAEEIGISGASDDMAAFMPVHDHLQPAIDTDPHSTLLLRSYQRKRARLHAQRVFLGRSRVATLTRTLGDRPPCTYLGRCLWGCPSESLYTPKITLRRLLRMPGFTYRPGLVVEALRYSDDGRVHELAASSLEGGEPVSVPVERLVLAAGALSTTRIVLESVRRATGELIALDGLMDNRQALVPFSNLRMLGKSFDPRSYQYNQLCMGLETERPEEYVHGLVTTLTTAMLHPVAQQLPLDLGTSLWVTRAMHATLGVVNVNFHDRRRSENVVRLEAAGADAPPVLSIRYRPPADEDERISWALAKVKKALWKLGCVVPPGMAHQRPMGASVHYSGTLPMADGDDPWTTRADGSLRAFKNVFVADGATFPFLPAKNLTFTLMANAARIADGL